MKKRITIFDLKTALKLVFILHPIFATLTYAHPATKFSSSNISPSLIKCAPKEPASYGLNAGTNSLSNLYLAFAAAGLAHVNDGEQLEKQVLDWGFENFNFLRNKRGTRKGFIAENLNLVLISFRGTAGLLDHRNNLLFDQKSVVIDNNQKKAKISIHAGMYNAFRDLKSSLIENLESLENSDKPIILTGHSLGGSLAIIFGHYLKINGFNIHHVYTAGSPKVGDDSWNQAVNSTIGPAISSVMVKTDVTTMLPPSQNSAERFSNLLSSKVGIVRVWTRNFIFNLGFTSNPGRHYLIDVETSRLTPIENIVQYENDFWLDLASSLATQSRNPFNLESLQRQINQHHPDNYICGIVDIIDRSKKSLALEYQY